MFWITQPSGRRYLYRAERVGDTVRKRYVGCDSPPTRELALLSGQCDELMASRRADHRQLSEAWRTFERDRSRVAATTDAAEAIAAVMTCLGYHKHKRGDWRMKRTKNASAQPALPAPPWAMDRSKEPLILFTAPDAERVAIFAKARAGDAEAMNVVRASLADPRTLDWMADLGKLATHQLIAGVANADPILREALTLKMYQMRRELEGDTPTLLEKLLARRIVNAWLFVHTAEITLTLTRELRRRAALERSISQGERRLLACVRELAVVRRLQAPALLAQLQIVARNQQQALPTVSSGSGG